MAIEFPKSITVADLDAEFMHTVDVDSIREHGYDTDEEYDSYFVLTEDGDYIAVYGMHGSVPYNHKTLYLLNS